MTNHDEPPASPAGQEQGPASADQDWFGGRRWTGIAALAVVLLLLVCVAVVIIAARGRHHTTTGSGPAPSNSSAAPTGVSLLPTAVPTEPPAGTSWQLYETIALPVVAGAGPTQITDGGAIATGYAHTPVGALVALANESIRVGAAPNSTWRKAAMAMVAPGPGLAAWVKVRAANPYPPGGSAASAGSDGAGGAYGQVAGFQFVSYTPTDAAIQLITTAAAGGSGYNVAAGHVTWSGGDWKVVLNSDGSSETNVAHADSTAGFIAWKGI